MCDKWQLIFRIFKQVPPVETKRILSYFNQFVSNSVQLLNKFAVVCDTKLVDLNFRLQDVEATLAILEAKVSFMHCVTSFLEIVSVAKEASIFIISIAPHHLK